MTLDIIHGDVKCENVLVFEAAEGENKGIEKATLSIGASSEDL